MDFSIDVIGRKWVGYNMGSLGIGGLFDYSLEGIASSFFKILEDGTLTVLREDYEGLLYPISGTIIQYLQGTQTVVGSHTIQLNYILKEEKGSSSQVYVSTTGDNKASGTYAAPVQSISLAYERVCPGGEILLYSGGYGSLPLIEKPVTIKALSGEKATFLDISGMPSGSYHLEGLSFNRRGISSSGGEITSNGSLTVLGCSFEGPRASLAYEGTGFLSIQQTFFKGGASNLLDIRSVAEVLLVSNVIAGDGTQSVSLDDIKYLDCIHNTVDNLSSLFIDDSKVGQGYGVKYLTITEETLNSKKAVFPFQFAINARGVPAVAVNLMTGSAASYGPGFTVTAGNTISWGGLLLEEALAVGDILRVVYVTAGNPGGSPGFVNIDSNNLTNITNIQFSSGAHANVHHNNFYGSGIGLLLGVSNILANPEYLDSANKNYMLANSSPCRHSASGAMKNDIASMLLTAQYNYIRGVLGGIHRRNPEGPDIGAFINFSHVTNSDTESVIQQEGYDYIGSGTLTSPIRSLSHAYTKGKNISFSFGSPNPGISGRKQYWFEDNISLASQTMGRVNDIPNIPGVSSDSDLRVINRDSACIQVGTAIQRKTPCTYVASWGDDQLGTGSKEKPFRTIQKAVLGSNPIVSVEAGNYPYFAGTNAKELVFTPSLKTRVLAKYSTSEMAPTLWEVVHEDDVAFNFELPFTVIHD